MAKKTTRRKAPPVILAIDIGGSRVKVMTSKERTRRAFDSGPNLSAKEMVREVKALVEAGDQRAAVGVDVYVHRLVSYIGSYTALLGGLDALVFTAGVGENADWIRERVLARLAPFGVELDAEANAVRSKQPRAITTPTSRVPVLVVPTNEELAMARQVVQVLAN